MWALGRALQWQGEAEVGVHQEAVQVGEVAAVFAAERNPDFPHDQSFHGLLVSQIVVDDEEGVAEVHPIPVHQCYFLQLSDWDHQCLEV